MYTRNLNIKLHILLFGLVSLLILVSPGFACECSVSAAPVREAAAQAVAKADVVFIGRVDFLPDAFGHHAKHSAAIKFKIPGVY